MEMKESLELFDIYNNTTIYLDTNEGTEELQLGMVSFTDGKPILRLHHKWKPEEYDNYYTINFGNENLTFRVVWSGDIFDMRLLKRGLVFKTREEALEVANRMLETLKGD